MAVVCFCCFSFVSNQYCSSVARRTNKQTSQQDTEIDADLQTQHMMRFLATRQSNESKIVFELTHIQIATAEFAVLVRIILYAFVSFAIIVWFLSLQMHTIFDS